MTNKEAKATLSVFQEEILDTLWLSMEQRKGLAEALDLAIKALDEKPFEINVFLESADESTLFDIKKELARILTERAEREAYEEARREAMKLDDNEDTLKWKGTH